MKTATIYQLPGRYPLTAKQYDVARRRAIGVPMKIIAREMEISLRTVRSISLVAKNKLGEDGWLRLVADEASAELQRRDSAADGRS